MPYGFFFLSNKYSRGKYIFGNLLFWRNALRNLPINLKQYFFHEGLNVRPKNERLFEPTLHGFSYRKIEVKPNSYI